MVELLLACYEIEGFGDHETSVFRRSPPGSEIVCSKNPGDLLCVGPLLRIDPSLWVIVMIRDPRDVIVSRHARDPATYWAHLGFWMRRRRAAQRVSRLPRVLEIRYEDVIGDPERVQNRIERHMPFLRRRAEFTEFPEIANPSEDARAALGGVRPLTPSSIGAWRRHKPRVVAQLMTHGSIDRDLVRYGYETDDSWHSELAGVVPENGSTHFPERESLARRAFRFLRRTLRTALYAGSILVSRR